MWAILPERCSSTTTCVLSKGGREALCCSLSLQVKTVNRMSCLGLYSSKCCLVQFQSLSIVMSKRDLDEAGVVGLLRCHVNVDSSRPPV